MRRGSAALVGLSAVAVALVAMSLIVPSVRGVPAPDGASVVLSAALLGVAIMLGRRRIVWPAILLGSSGALWCLLGFATLLPDPAPAILARAGVLPFALLVVVVVWLPFDRPPRSRWASSALVVGIAVFGGVGAPVPVRLTLGAVLVGTAAWSVAHAARVKTLLGREGRLALITQIAFGPSLVVLDPVLSGEVLDAGTAAGATMLLMATAALAAYGILDRDWVDRGFERSADDKVEDQLGVEGWLAALLGAPGLRVAYPAPAGWCREDGSPCVAGTGQRVVGPTGDVVALFDRPVLVEPRLHSRLNGLLVTVGSSARLRAALHEKAAELTESQARLAVSRLLERDALQRRLRSSITPRLDAIASRMDGLPGADEVIRRVGAAREQLDALTHGTAAVHGRSLREALGDLAALAPRRVSVDLAALDADGDVARPDADEADVLWFAAAEAVTNAVKHAADAAIRLRAVSPCRVVVDDSGPGGADPAGAGLSGLRERVGRVSGQVALRSGPQGTSLSVTVPGRIRGSTYDARGLPATTAESLGSYRR